MRPATANLYETPLASHHLLEAHAEAVRRYRALGRHQIGLVLNLEPKEPASSTSRRRGGGGAGRRLR